MASLLDERPQEVQIFEGDWDDEGVYVYQAFGDEIADWALANQRFGGPKFNPSRMTWIKPSFAWVLYRSGYGFKKNQNRVLKIKLSHESIAHILSQCVCKEGGGGCKGRVQWDPARDIMMCENKEPRKLLRTRAIQIGISKSLSEYYVNSVISIADVTALAHQIGKAHRTKGKNLVRREAMIPLLPLLPFERPYLPQCSQSVLEGLGLMPGRSAKWIAQLGRGKVPRE